MCANLDIYVKEITLCYTETKILKVSPDNAL